MLLHDAETIAEWLVDVLHDGAERIEIAGSIRRGKPEVKDIEIVVIPRFAQRAGDGQMGLGGPPPVVSVNVLRERVEALGVDLVQPIKPGTHEVIPWRLNDDGSYWRLWLPAREIKVDVFLCAPETWGLNYLIRTGSADFSRAVLMRWKAVSGGGHSAGLRLTWPDGRHEAAPEEADVFKACRMEWVIPARRVDEMAAVRAQMRPVAS